MSKTSREEKNGLSLVKKSGVRVAIEYVEESAAGDRIGHRNFASVFARCQRVIQRILLV